MNKQVDCLFFREHLDQYLDSELAQDTRNLMNEHARQCPDCGQRLETMTRLLTMCAEMDEGLSVPLEAQLSWRKAIREESRQTSRSGGRFISRAIGTIAAAAVLLAGGTFAYRITNAPMPEEALSARPAISRGTGVAQNASVSYGAKSALSDYAPQSEQDFSLEVDGEFDEVPTYNINVEGSTPGSVQVLPDSGVRTDDNTQAQEETATAEQKRIILRDAVRTIETSSFDQHLSALQNIAGEYSDGSEATGYIESYTVEGQPIEPGMRQGRTAHLVVRIPQAQLDEFLTSLNAIGATTYQNEYVRDISSNYYDVQSRLNSYRTMLTRLNELVTTAADMEGMLQLQDKLSEVQLEIDQLEGQLRSWDHHATLSSVSISLIEVPVRDQIQQPTGGETLEQKIRAAFYDSLNWLNKFLQDSLVVLAMALPALVIIIPLIIVICIIVSAVRRRRRRRKNG